MRETLITIFNEESQNVESLSHRFKMKGALVTVCIFTIAALMVWQFSTSSKTPAELLSSHSLDTSHNLGAYHCKEEECIEEHTGNGGQKVEGENTEEDEHTEDAEHTALEVNIIQENQEEKQRSKKEKEQTEQ